MSQANMITENGPKFFNTLLSYKPPEDGSVLISFSLLAYVCVLCWKLFERKDIAALLEEALSYCGGGKGTLSGEYPLRVLHSSRMTWCGFSYYLRKTCMIGHKLYIFLCNYSINLPQYTVVYSCFILRRYLHQSC